MAWVIQQLVWLLVTAAACTEHCHSQTWPVHYFDGVWNGELI